MSFERARPGGTRRVVTVAWSRSGAAGVEGGRTGPRRAPGWQRAAAALYPCRVQVVPARHAAADCETDAVPWPARHVRPIRHHTGDQRREAHLPAEQPSSLEAARLPPSHERPQRSRDPASPSTEGPEAAVGLIWRVRGTEEFAGFRGGHRASHGPLTVVVVPDTRGEPPRVAFAIGRKVGGAVIRNRLRRQLREHLRHLPQPDAISSGAHLVIVRPGAAGLGGAALGAHLDAALGRARQRAEVPA